VQPVLVSQALRKGFAAPHGRLEVLRGVELAVLPGETLAVLGPSGSGKSTLLHLLAGLDRGDGGSVWWDGYLVDPAAPGLAARRAQHVGLIFQHHYLLAELTVLENVTLPGRIAGRRVDEEAAALLGAMSLAGRERSTLRSLSGGERQRVAVARALVLGPRVVLADEPTGSLDRANAQAVYAVLRDAARARGTALVVVTHDEALVADADRRVRLEEGRLEPA
jgi:lipoprotein-releasing system ATP-binding protein